MLEENKLKYLTLIDQKLDMAKKRLSDLEQARNSSESAMTSRFDTQRESLERDADRQKEIILGLDNFRTFLDGCQEKQQIENGAEFMVEFTSSEDGIDKALFAPISVNLEGVQIITPQSPLGKAILGKKEGESFEYLLDGVKVAGIVKKIV